MPYEPRSRSLPAGIGSLHEWHLLVGARQCIIDILQSKALENLRFNTSVHDEDRLMRFAVFGAGGLGAYYGARLVDAGYEVSFIGPGAAS